MNDLPTSAQILQMIPKLKTTSLEEAEGIRDWAFEKAQIFQDTVSKFIEKVEIKEDPDIYQERLYRYHLLCGGLSGLSEALYERIKFLVFKDITEESKETKKLTANDRELYAKGQVADIKGLVTSLNNMASNLESRLYGCRMNMKRW